MPDYGHDLQFGVFLSPDAVAAARTLELAQLADVLGYELVTVQDHPYQAKHLDAWTLLAAIAARTSAVRVAPNVANLPLRPPAVLAQAVATLDIISDGRAELGPGRRGVLGRDRRGGRTAPHPRRGGPGAGGGHRDHPRRLGRGRQPDRRRRR